MGSKATIVGNFSKGVVLAFGVLLQSYFTMDTLEALIYFFYRSVLEILKPIKLAHKYYIYMVFNVFLP